MTDVRRSKTYTNVQPLKVPENGNEKTILIDLAKGELEEWAKNIRYTKTIVNRNVNASLHILFKGICVIEGKELPKRFKRDPIGV